jgi:hypothetical protein
MKKKRRKRGKRSWRMLYFAKSRLICGPKKLILALALSTFSILVFLTTFERENCVPCRVDNDYSQRAIGTAQDQLSYTPVRTQSCLPSLKSQWPKLLFQYDSFYISPNWTLYDVRRKRNTNQSFFPTYVRGQFAKLDSNLNRRHDVIGNNSLETNFVIYNRVPKCGSTTVKLVAFYMRQLHNFTTYSSKVFASHSLPVEEEREFSSYATSKPPGGKAVFYDRHMYFIDMSKYVAASVSGRHKKDRIPNWINFARHPVDRFASDFYYLRKEKRWREEGEGKPSMVPTHSYV